MPGLRRICSLAVFFPAVFYIGTIVLCGVDVPVGDDYAVILPFADTWVNNGQTDFFAAHNEHRPFCTRLCTAASLCLFGRVDFHLFLVLSGFAISVSAWLLTKLIGLRTNWLSATLLILLLLPQPEKLIHYPMAGLQAYFGILFSVLYLLLVTGPVESRPVPFWLRKDLLAVPLQVAAMLTTGAGLFLPLIGVPILIASGRKGLAAMHTLVACIAAALYLPGLSGSSSLSYVLSHPLQVAHFFIVLAGGASEFPYLGSNHISTVLAGLTVLTAVLCLVWSGVHREHPGAIAALAFPLLNLFLIACGRVPNYVSQYALTAMDGRYQIYSLLLWATVSVLILQHISTFRSSRAFSILVLAGATMFAFGFYTVEWHMRPLISNHRQSGVELWVQQRNPAWLHRYAMPQPEAARLLQMALDSGTYAPVFLRSR